MPRAAAGLQRALAVDRRLLRLHRGGVHRHRLEHGRHVARDPPQHELRQPRNLEHRHVPGASQLAKAHVGATRGRMRQVHHDEPLHELGAPHREPPRDHPAPVVGHDRRLLRPRRVDQRRHVVHQTLERVGRHRVGLVREAVAAQVRRPDPVAERRQQRRLVPPRVPALGKPVQAQRQRVAVTETRQVEAQPVRLDEGVPERIVRRVLRRIEDRVHARGVRATAAVCEPTDRNGPDSLAIPAP